MGEMERVPQIKAAGLSEDYRLLADFNGAVLAGHRTERDVQFVTWLWDYDRTGVTLGHYFGDEYQGALEQIEQGYKATQAASGAIASSLSFNDVASLFNTAVSLSKSGVLTKTYLSDTVDLSNM